MTSRFGNSSLMLAIIFCGTLVGAFTYSRFIFNPVYTSPIHPSAIVATGADGVQEEVFWMFMHPIAVLSLYVALVLNWKNDSRRPLILVAILVYCLALAATRVFFVREFTAFVESPVKIAVPTWLVSALQWQQLGWMRAALMYIAEISLLIALMRPLPATAELTVAAQ